MSLYVYVDSSSGTVEFRLRLLWRIHGNSNFISNIAWAIHMHQTVTTLNRGWTEEQRIEIAPLSKLLWVAVCLQAFTNAFCRGSHRGDALVGGRPLDPFFPMTYIFRQMQHLQSRNYESIRVGVLRRLPARSRSGDGQVVLLFNFSNPTAEDNRFYHSIVKLALEADDAQPIG